MSALFWTRCVANECRNVCTPTRFSITDAGLSCGYDWAMPVVDDYRAPFRFPGGLHRVIVDVDGEPFVDAEAEADLALRAQ